MQDAIQMLWMPMLACIYMHIHTHTHIYTVWKILSLMSVYLGTSCLNTNTNSFKLHF
jgi:hypothetical protein